MVGTSHRFQTKNVTSARGTQLVQRTTQLAYAKMDITNFQDTPKHRESVTVGIQHFTEVYAQVQTLNFSCAEPNANELKH
jgi:hypothetical protein